MDNWFANRRWLIIFISIIILALVMSMTVKGREDVSLPEKILIDASVIIQKVLYKPANFVAGLYNDIQEIRNVHAENSLLRERLESMSNIEVELKMMNEENDRIRKLLNFKESIRDYEVVAANVVSRSPIRWDNIITIDRGKKHGIELNMAVINHEGLIGKVFAVSNYGAKVLLLTDSNATFGISSVILGKDESFGVIEGYVSEYGYLVMSMIKPDIRLEKGDTVITSGFGGVFPKGLLIGNVVAAKKTEGGLTQSIYLEPAVNTSSLNEVLVIKRTLKIADMVDNEEFIEEEE